MASDGDSESDLAATGAPAPAPAVFLSYASADRDRAQAILAILRTAGLAVWWDGMIPGGRRYNDVISEALENAKAVVVLWSQASKASHWVHDEAARGRDRGCLVPLSIDGSEPPLGFGQFQTFDVSGPALSASQPAMQRALASITALVDGGPAVPLNWATGSASDPAAAQARQPRPATARVTRRQAVAVGAGLVAVGGGLATWGWRRPVAGSANNTIAVLPFDPVGGDTSQRYFSEGLSAELRAQLSRNPELSVMGQASSNTFRNSNKDGRSIARALNVAHLLDGNVRAEGGLVRISVELIAGDTGLTRWSQIFEGALDDVFKLQERIAQSVDAALSVQLGGPEDHKTGGGGSDSVPAFDAFARGRALFEAQIDEASDRAALAHFDEAIRIDPHYAAAHAARSRVLAVIGSQYAQSAERLRLFAEAVDEARIAIREAPAFADGHAALGSALFYGKLDVIAADDPYEQAYRLGRGSADILSRYALYNARRRRFERASPAIDHAVELDPLNPSVFKAQGLIAFARGDYQPAIASAQRALALNPARATLHGDIGNAQLMLGQVDAAAASFAREKSALLALPGRAFVAVRRGQERDVAAAFAELVRTQGDNGLYQQAQVLAQWGKSEQALAALARARAEQDAGMVLLLNDPFLAPLRKTPAYMALLRQLHFV